MNNTNNKMNRNDSFFSIKNQEEKLKNFTYKNNVLKNKLNIRSELKLSTLEDKLVKAKLVKLLINKENTLDSASLETNEDKLQFLKDINEFLYGDLYDFAGKIRDINLVASIEDGITEFVPITDIQDIEQSFADAVSKFNKDNYHYCSKEEKVVLLSLHMSQLWQVQPFFKGNAIGTMLFTQQFAQRELGLTIDINKLSKNNVNVMIQDFLNSEPDSLINALDSSIKDEHKYDKLFDETSLLDQCENQEEEQEDEDDLVL